MDPRREHGKRSLPGSQSKGCGGARLPHLVPAAAPWTPAIVSAPARGSPQPGTDFGRAGLFALQGSKQDLCPVDQNALELPEQEVIEHDQIAAPPIGSWNTTPTKEWPLASLRTGA